MQIGFIHGFHYLFLVAIQYKNACLFTYDEPGAG